jgi:hypothetical protein
VVGKHLRTSAELERQIRAAHQLRAETLPLLTRNQLLWLARGAALILRTLRTIASRHPRAIRLERGRLPEG